jgi:hypothetical protein
MVGVADVLSRKVQKLKSCGLAVVKVQHAAESLAFSNRSIGCDRSLGWHDQAVVESLMVSFQMVQPDNEIPILP